jgi:hypothetical protein
MVGHHLFHLLLGEWHSRNSRRSLRPNSNRYPFFRPLSTCDVLLWSDISGDIGPFQLAILLTVIALVLILAWEENYGNDSTSSAQESPLMSESILSSFQVIVTNPAIFCLGMSQAFFEGGVYTFGELLPLFLFLTLV